MSEEQPPDYVSLAVEHVFTILDSEWSDRLVDLIKRVNAEAFKARLLEAHKQKSEHFNAAAGGEKTLPSALDRNSGELS